MTVAEKVAAMLQLIEHESEAMLADSMIVVSRSRLRVRRRER